MRVRDVFDRAAACRFIEGFLGDPKKASKGAASRIAACELEIAPCSSADVELMTVGGVSMGIPKADLDALLFGLEAA